MANLTIAVDDGTLKKARMRDLEEDTRRHRAAHKRAVHFSGRPDPGGRAKRRRRARSASRGHATCSRSTSLGRNCTRRSDFVTAAVHSPAKRAKKEVSHDRLSRAAHARLYRAGHHTA